MDKKVREFKPELGLIRTSAHHKHESRRFSLGRQMFAISKDLGLPVKMSASSNHQPGHLSTSTNMQCAAFQKQFMNESFSRNCLPRGSCNCDELAGMGSARPIWSAWGRANPTRLAK
jgi:hypothetical protein